MQKINKKAVSNIIATVSLLLITIVAVSLLGVYINKSVSLQLSPKMNCLQMQTSPPIEIKKACYNLEEKIELTISRKISTNIPSLDFIISSPSKSETFCCETNECSDCIILEQGQTKTYSWKVEKLEENSNAGVIISNCLIGTRKIVSC